MDDLDKWMPEVGQIVLAERSTSEWVEAEFLGQPKGDFKGMAFAKTAKSKELFYAFSWKHLKTEAEIKREEAVADMKAVFDKLTCLPDESFFGKLYDEGYKKLSLSDEEIDEFVGKTAQRETHLNLNKFARLFLKHLKGEI